MVMTREAAAGRSWSFWINGHLVSGHGTEMTMELRLLRRQGGGGGGGGGGGDGGARESVQFPVLTARATGMPCDAAGRGQSYPMTDSVGCSLMLWTGITKPTSTLLWTPGAVVDCKLKEHLPSPPRLYRGTFVSSFV